MVKDVSRWTNKYEQRASAATDEYVAGVQSPKRPPASSAIANRKTFEQKMAQKDTFDKWEGGLRAVGDEGVIKAAIEKGAPRYAPGIRAGMPKVVDFANKFSAHLDAGQKKVLAIPKVTLADSEKRMVEMMRHNATFRYKK